MHGTKRALLGRQDCHELRDQKNASARYADGNNVSKAKGKWKRELEIQLAAIAQPFAASGLHRSATLMRRERAGHAAGSTGA